MKAESSYNVNRLLALNLIGAFVLSVIQAVGHMNGSSALTTFLTQMIWMAGLATGTLGMLWVLYGGAK